MLVPPVPENTGLRKPYQYRLSTVEGTRLINSLKAATAPYKTNKLQCALIDEKAVKYGVRVNISLLGFAPGLCGDARMGITESEWNQVIKEVADLLKVLPDACLYAEDWSPSKKFQARFETYIHSLLRADQLRSAF